MGHDQPNAVWRVAHGPDLFEHWDLVPGSRCRHINASDLGQFPRFYLLSENSKRGNWILSVQDDDFAADAQIQILVVHCPVRYRVCRNRYVILVK